MEIDRPTAADYANSNAQAALQTAQELVDTSASASERLRALETMVRALTTVVDYLATGKSLESLSFDNSGNAVDNKDWEEITFDQIKLGDEIRYIVEYNGAVDISEGVVKEHDQSDNSWLLGDDYWAFGPDYYDEGGSTYLRKIKPFVWPKELGSVIEVGWEVDSNLQTFVRVRPSDHKSDQWFHVQTGNMYKEWELEVLYENPRVATNG